MRQAGAVGRREHKVQGMTQIDIEIIYAAPESIWQHRLQLPPGSTVNDALGASHFFDLFPAYSTETVQVGIFGQQCALEHELAQNDRIEIYRPLVFDPMESRRRRAQHRQRTKN